MLLSAPSFLWSPANGKKKKEMKKCIQYYLRNPTWILQSDSKCVCYIDIIAKGSYLSINKIHPSLSYFDATSTVHQFVLSILPESMNWNQRLVIWHPMVDESIWKNAASSSILETAFTSTQCSQSFIFVIKFYM